MKDHEQMELLREYVRMAFRCDLRNGIGSIIGRQIEVIVEENSGPFLAITSITSIAINPVSKDVGDLFVGIERFSAFMKYQTKKAGWEKIAERERRTGEMLKELTLSKSMKYSCDLLRFDIATRNWEFAPILTYLPSILVQHELHLGAEMGRLGIDSPAAELSRRHTAIPIGLDGICAAVRLL